jgi:phage terminase large subunit
VVLKRCRFDAVKCSDGIEALRAYHYKYDEEQKIFSSDPDHDWSSHAADAFCEGAAVLQDFVEPPPKPDPYAQVTVPMNQAYSLEQLWETVGPSQGARRV